MITFYQQFEVKLPITQDDYTKLQQNICNLKQPWITPAILISCHRKNVLYKQFLRKMITKDTNVTYNNLIKIIEERKLQYYSDLITKSMRNSRNIWKHINSLLGKSTHSTNSLYKYKFK